MINLQGLRGEHMKQPLIILSFDGMDTRDLEYLKKKPNFSRFLKDASGSKHVKTIYPSVTYAAHASIITGCYPKRHGIVDNTKVQPQRYETPDWYWFSKDVKVKTLYDVAKDEGYSIAALLWPTTGRANIDYNMPEIFSNRKWTSQLMVSLYAGTPGFQFKMVSKYDHLRDGKSQPALDHFTSAVTVDTILNEQPDMLLVHLTDLDSIRHLYGHDSQEAYKALDRHDERLGRFLDALSSHEKYNHAFKVILGDHSSIDVTHGISLNGKLLEWSYLSRGVNGFTDIQVISKSCDGSAYIYLNEPSVAAVLKEKLESLVCDHTDKMSLFYQPDITNMGADPKAFAMLEATPPYHFVDDDFVPLIKPITEIPYYKGKAITAVHGFYPQKEAYDTCFYISGPGIIPLKEIEQVSLVDISPTLAGLLKWDLPDTDGQSKHLQLLQEDIDETN